MELNEAAYLDMIGDLQKRNWPASVPAEPRYPHGEIAISEYLRAWAAAQPDKPAIVFYGTTISFAELDALSDRFAALLSTHGVQSGDRVAVMLPNCPQFHIVFYGILKLGAIHVPVNPLFKDQELLYELNDAGARIIVAQDQLVPMVLNVRQRTPVLTVMSTSFADMLPESPTLPVPGSVLAAKVTYGGTIDLMQALHECTAPVPQVRPDLDAPAALNYTGGTTGMPKGCVHTQRDMIYTAATTCTIAEFQPDDIVLNFMSLFWIAGENAGLIFPVFSGNTLILLARWDPVGVMAAVEKYAVTRLGLLVDNAIEILEHPDAGRYSMRSLRATRASSFVKKMNPSVRRQWLALTGTTIAEAAWGMSETHTCDTFTRGFQGDDQDLKGQPVFVGLPVPGTRIKICDFETGALKPVGEEGEIVVKTPSLLKSYWNKPEATAQSMRDGWFATGDIGVYDEQGCLHFLGRRKEMLKVKGMSVFPTELEALLGQHPAVLGSGVIGMDDPDKGQVPVAFVQINPNAGITEEGLAQWCRENMATYKVPLIRFVDQLPMTATGKVKKFELADLLNASGLTTAGDTH
ncbi:MAG TPA: AMP-binding protein [Noviherbaspirillum sp.]|uniref:AMP-binding protein n=1 Tax=Noviherbaspirillum sp. TaxID=1926288 RepID=UPI002DDCCDB1|nr:AMP-binding protein [Noviherbaspirillum sp.]HEV2610283.1 AMP-binding protein [Noviherbaspirillum sp.]